MVEGEGKGRKGKGRKGGGGGRAGSHSATLRYTRKVFTHTINKEHICTGEISSVSRQDTHKRTKK